MADLVSIIIVAHNQLAYTQRCVDSIRRHTVIPYELVLVDNGSDDGTLEYFLNQEAVVLHNDHNESFARAANLGIHGARGDVLVILNNDTVVTPNWLGNMIKCLESGPDVGLVGPVSNYSHANPFCGAPNSAGPEMEEFARNHNVPDPGKWFDVPTFLPGFCLAMTSRVFYQVGYLDEQFTTGIFEDYDYSMKVKKAGYRLVCAGDTFIFHEGSVTLMAKQINTVSLSKENEKLFLRKWAAAKWDGVDIVIVNYNTCDLLANCLRHLAAHTPVAHQIYVVDNGSSDGSGEFLKSQPGLKVVFNHNNLGMAKGWNQGLLLGQGKYIVFLHPDIQVGSNWLQPMLQAAEADPAVAVVGNKQVGADGRIIHAGTFGMDKVPILRGHGLPDSPELFPRSEECLDISGACCLIKRQLLPVLGMFDERYFIYGVDSDYAINARHHGYQVVYSPSAVIHLESGNPEIITILNDFQPLDSQSYQDKWVSLIKGQPNLSALPPEMGPPPRKLKILVPVQKFIKSGGMRFLCQMANMLVERGHDITFMVPKGTNLPPFPLQARVEYYDLVDPIALGLTRQKIPGANLTPHGGKVFNPATFPPADLIIANWFTTAHSVALAPKGVPVHLIMGYEADFFQTPESKPACMLAQSTYQLNTRGLTISNWLRQKLLRQHGKDCSLINPGIDTRIFTPRPKTKGMVKRIMTVGSSDQIKGFNDFIHAMELVAAREQGIELLIASRGPLTVPTTLPHRLVHPPTDQEMAFYYQQADVFVTSSWEEGFGLPPLEAIACGVPVVVTDCGGVHEYAVHGVNCLMVPSRNPKAIAQGVLTLLRDEGLRNYVINLGLATVQNFSWEKALVTFESYATQIVAAGRPKPTIVPRFSAPKAVTPKVKAAAARPVPKKEAKPPKGRGGR
ncbi:MAG: glycosyltransferase [Thermincolia bacterium]